MKIGLEQSRFVVDSFNDSLFRINEFQDRVYELLLLDIKMPEMKNE